MKSMNHRGVRFIGALMVLAATTTAGSASARTLTGWGAIRPWPSLGSQSCISEDYGAAYSNACSGPQTMVFELPVDSGNANHTVTAWDYVHGNGAFQCQAQSIQAQGAVYGDTWEYNLGQSQGFIAGPQEALSFSVNVPLGWSLRVVCLDVPVGQGIASLDYNP
jgi:hypothetical protein